MKKCPFCAEEILLEAIVCKHCNRDLVKPPPQKVQYIESPKKSMSVGDGVRTGCGMFIMLPLIIIGGFILLMIMVSMCNH